MQLLSSAHHILPGPTSSGGHAIPESSSTSGGFSVTVLTTVSTFLSSLYPGYTPERARPLSLVSDPGEAVVSRKNWQDGANDAAQKLKLACTIASCWVPQVQVVSDAVASLCSSFSLARDLGSVLEHKDGEKNCAAGTATLSASTAAALAVIALDNLTTAAAAPAPGSAQNPIRVPDSETLAKIGQDGYPTDAYYLQNNSFSHNSTVPGASFRGHYDGGCHTINDLNNCLFRNLEPYAEVRNLRLANATVDTDQQYLALLACEMAPYSRASNIQVEHVSITNRARGSVAAPAATGIICGYQQRSSRVMATDVRHCSVLATKDHSIAAVVGGLVGGLNQDGVVSHCRVETSGNHAPAGIGAGKLSGLTKDMTVLDSQVTTAGESSVAGVGAGLALGTLEQVAVLNGRVRTSGKSAFAAIGAGQVGYPRSLDYGLIDGLLSVNGSVITEGERASAGIGTGQLNGEANRVISVSSAVRTRGDMASAGINNGDMGVNAGGSGESRNLVIVNSSVNTEGGGDENMITGTVRSLTIINSRRGSESFRDEGSVDFSKLCAGADSRFIASDCTVIPGPTRWNCSSAPLNPGRDSFWVPIEINNIESLNRIGLSPGYPSYAHYVQTSDLDGTLVNTSRSLVFTGHYNGQNRAIRDLQTCLFSDLRGTLRNLHLTGARISSEGQGAAVLACRMSDASTIDNVTFSNCQVTSHGPALAGIVSAERHGRANQVTRIKVHDAMVATDGDAAHAGVIAGQCHGQTREVDIYGSRVITHGEGACAGVGGGIVQSRFENASFLCSQAETVGREARAGIGAGRVAYGRVGPITVIKGAVNTTGVRAHGGIGAGEIDKFGAAGHVTSLQSLVMTSGPDADAGIGGGTLDAERFGRAMGVDAVDCEVQTRGPRTHAGVGVGSLRLRATDTEPYTVRLANFTSIDNTVEASGVQSHASINGFFFNGDSVGEARPASSRALNTRVNDQIYDRGFYINNDTLCARGDHRFVTPKCQPKPAPLAQNCPQASVFAPAPATPVAPATAVAPALVATSPSLLAGIILGSFVLFGGSALAAYLSSRHRREAPAAADESLPKPPVESADK